jgi:hypothetical protein
MHIHSPWYAPAQNVRHLAGLYPDLNKYPTPPHRKPMFFFAKHSPVYFR